MLICSAITGAFRVTSLTNLDIASNSIYMVYNTIVTCFYSEKYAGPLGLNHEPDSEQKEEKTTSRYKMEVEIIHTGGVNKETGISSKLEIGYTFTFDSYSFLNHLTLAF